MIGGSMSLELDPILEETLHDVHSSINNITEQIKLPVFLKIFVSIFTNTFQWLENVRLPSSLERASLVIVKLNKVEEHFTSNMQTISRSKQLELENTQRFISTHILEKLNYFKEAIT